MCVMSTQDLYLAHRASPAFLHVVITLPHWQSLSSSQLLDQEKESKSSSNYI